MQSFSSQSVDFFYKSKWPKKINPCFGDKQVHELAEDLDVCFGSSVYGFPEYFISGNCDQFPSEFQPLVAAVNTYNTYCRR
jgi:hypothetical protein